jgi:hypothetical protein
VTALSTSNIFQDHPARAWLAFTLAALALCWSAPGSAQDGVQITFHGGTSRADVYQLIEDDGDFSVSEQGQRQLIADDIGLQVINDHKLLPDGSNLLAGVGGRGVVITDASGETNFILAPSDTYPRSTSASVIIYAAPGEPGRILLSESNTTRLLLIEPGDRQIVWQSGFQLPGASGYFADAIAMPRNRVVSGIEYTNLGLSAIDVIEFTPGPTGTVLRRITNREHANGPQNQVELEGLHPVRDVLGLPNGHILAATDERLYEIDLGGRLQWSTQVTGRAEINGEIWSIALMPSGRVAVATVEPGEWTQPHPNHRVHWLARAPLESGTVEVVGTTPSLRRAPASIETDGGHGGSGTFGYRPGLDPIGEGTLADLGVARPLDFNQDEYTIEDAVSGSILVRNDGEDTVYVPEIRVRAVPGECGAANDEPPVTLFDGRFVELQPGSLFDLRGARQADEGLSLGRWCAQTIATDSDGASVPIGDPAYFEIVEPSADGGGSVTVRDVGFWEADAFNARRDNSPPANPPGGGCCSHSVHERTPGRVVLTGMLLLVLGLARRVFP